MMDLDHLKDVDLKPLAASVKDIYDKERLKSANSVDRTEWNKCLARLALGKEMLIATLRLLNSDIVGLGGAPIELPAKYCYPADATQRHAFLVEDLQALVGLIKDNEQNFDTKFEFTMNEEPESRCC